MSDVLNSMFPMRGPLGAVLFLLKFFASLVFIVVLAFRKILTQKVKKVLRRPQSRRNLKFAIVVCIGAIVYAPFYSYLMLPVCVFWCSKVDWLGQLMGRHSAIIFWSVFALYLGVLLIICQRFIWVKHQRTKHINGINKFAPGHDAPIRRIADAKIDCSPFIKNIAEAVACADVRYEAEFIGIYGEWGSGKTSVVRMLEHSIQKGLVKYDGLKNALFVHFNPMEFQSVNDAFVGLFKESVARLKMAAEVKNVPRLNRLATAFREYSTSLYLRRVKLGLGTIGEMLEIVRQWIYLYIFRLAKSKQKLRFELKDSPVRLVLVIDDLERIPCKDVYSVFNFCKANIDLPNIVVLILSDSEHLARAMSLAMDDNTLSLGRTYLEKFITRHLDLPGIPREIIVQYFKKELSVALKDMGVRDYEGDFATVGDFVRTLRNVNRTIGSIWSTARYYHHYTGNNSLPFHIGDFAALAVVAEYEPNVHKNLRRLVHDLLAESNMSAYNPDWGVPENVFNKWLDDNVLHKEHMQDVKSFLRDHLCINEGRNKAGESIYRIGDGMRQQELNYSFRLASPSWINMYYRDFSAKGVANPDDVLSYERSIQNGIIPEDQLRRLIEENSLILLLDMLLGQSEFSTRKALSTFIDSLLWLACQKYNLRYFSDLSWQGFYGDTIYNSIFRVWLSYWTRIVKNASSSLTEKIGCLILDACKKNPACHFIRQLLSIDSPNHTKGAPSQLLGLSMFNDEQYEALVDLYIHAVKDLQSRGEVFNDPCYLDLLRAWNIVLIRRDDPKLYEEFRNSLKSSLVNAANILKLKLFFVRSVIYAGDGEEIVDGLYFTGIDLGAVERLFGLSLIKEISITLQKAYDSLSQEDKILSAALIFVAGMDLDPIKCSVEQQTQYLRDIFSPSKDTEMNGGIVKSVSALKHEFMTAISELNHVHQLAALGLAYQVRTIEKRDDTIELGHGLYVQSYEPLMQGVLSTTEDVYCPIFVYDSARIMMKETASNEEYLSASLNVSHNYLFPLTKSICSNAKNVYDEFAFLLKQNPFIDSGRISQCAKALQYGALGDFSSAAQLLFPQIEHLIRTILKANSVYEPGFKDSKGIGTLLQMPGAENAISMVQLFEFKALFTSRDHGLNIRNLFAHGQLSDYESNGLEAFYVWWFFLRMVVSLKGEPIATKSE